jgi:hypothetical protein
VASRWWRPLVFDQQHAHWPGDRNAEPWIAGAQVAGKVDHQRCLSGATIAVAHGVAGLRDERVVRRAEQRLAGG